MRWCSSFLDHAVVPRVYWSLFWRRLAPPSSCYVLSPGGELYEATTLRLSDLLPVDETGWTEWLLILDDGSIQYFLLGEMQPTKIKCHAGKALVKSD